MSVFRLITVNLICKRRRMQHADAPRCNMGQYSERHVSCSATSLDKIRLRTRVYNLLPDEIVNNVH